MIEGTVSILSHKGSSVTGSLLQTDPRSGDGVGRGDELVRAAFSPGSWGAGEQAPITFKAVGWRSQIFEGLTLEWLSWEVAWEKQSRNLGQEA